MKNTQASNIDVYDRLRKREQQLNVREPDRKSQFYLYKHAELQLSLLCTQVLAKSLKKTKQLPALSVYYVCVSSSFFLPLL